MTTENQLPVSNLELVSTTADIDALTRAEIDTQIATAKRYPRSMTTFKNLAIGMATIDEETAESCIYNRPVGKDKRTGDMKFAEGLSVRMAEIIGASYGNLRVGAMLIEMSERRVVARGVAHDLQTNFSAQTDVVESTVDSYGKPYSERMRAVVAKAALAKARRDATFQVVPKALCKPVEAAAKALIIGDGSASTLTKRRSAVLKWANSIGVPPSRVFASLGIKGEDDIGVEQLEKLTGIKTAIKEGDTTIDEAFPMPAAFTHPATPPMAESTAGAHPAQTPPSAGGASQVESPEPPAPSLSPQESLQAVIEQEGVTIDQFNKFGISTGHLKAEAATWDDVPLAVAKRLLLVKNLPAKIVAEIEKGGS